MSLPASSTTLKPLASFTAPRGMRRPRATRQWPTSTQRPFAVSSAMPAQAATFHWWKTPNRPRCWQSSICSMQAGQPKEPSCFLATTRSAISLPRSSNARTFTELRWPSPSPPILTSEGPPSSWSTKPSISSSRRLMLASAPAKKARRHPSPMKFPAKSFVRPSSMPSPTVTTPATPVCKFPSLPTDWKSGNLPPALTLEMLRQEHGSFPRNLLFAEALYLARYIERYGTGTGDMIAKCREAGLPEPDFELTDGFVTTIYRPAGTQSRSVRAHEAQAGTNSTISRNQSGTKKTKAQEAQEAQEAQVVLTPVEVSLLRSSLKLPRSAKELLNVAGYETRTGNFKRSLEKLLGQSLLEMTIPAKPTSNKQQYRTTGNGRRVLDQLNAKF